MRRWIVYLGFLVCCWNCSCAFEKSAKHWNGVVGPTGNPVYLNSTTKVGFNLVVFVQFIGKTDLDGMVQKATQQIHNEGGDYARVVQSHTENYWYALPPVTWVVTPVVSSLVIEYRPQPDWLSSPGTAARPTDCRPMQNYSWRGNDY